MFSQKNADGYQAVQSETSYGYYWDKNTRRDEMLILQGRDGLMRTLLQQGYL